MKTTKVTALIYVLCFRVGGYIRDNILQGIQQSRRTIVLLSQHFLDSEWCEFEFEMSQQQLLEDPNFKMIVILMQREELGKIPRFVNPILARMCNHYNVMS